MDLSQVGVLSPWSDSSLQPGDNGDPGDEGQLPRPGQGESLSHPDLGQKIYEVVYMEKYC